MVDIQPKLVVIAACGQPSKSPYTLKYFSPSIWWKRLCFIIIIFFLRLKSQSCKFEVLSESHGKGTWLLPSLKDCRIFLESCNLQIMNIFKATDVAQWLNIQNLSEVYGSRMVTDATLRGIVGALCSFTASAVKMIP